MSDRPLDLLPLGTWNVERRDDGAVLVRVHSRGTVGHALPDAVFAFRAGDPQFSYWDAQLRDRELRAADRPDKQAS